jgi:hypothetical protein
LSENKHEVCLARAEAECRLTIDSCLFHLRQHYAVNEGDHTLQLIVFNYRGELDKIVWDVMGSLPQNIEVGGEVTEQKIEICTPMIVNMQSDDELMLVHSLNVQLLDSTSININRDEIFMSS